MTRLIFCMSTDDVAIFFQQAIEIRQINTDLKTVEIVAKFQFATSIIIKF